ncbi:MAG: hypothetical protein AAFP86_15950, partial [Planctomycetota bacterium]
MLALIALTLAPSPQVAPRSLEVVQSSEDLTIRSIRTTAHPDGGLVVATLDDEQNFGQEGRVSRIGADGRLIWSE